MPSTARSTAKLDAHIHTFFQLEEMMSVPVPSLLLDVCMEHGTHQPGTYHISPADAVEDVNVCANLHEHAEKEVLRRHSQSQGPG